MVCRHAFIINNTGRTSEIDTFKLDYEALQKVPIFDYSIL